MLKSCIYEGSIRHRRFLPVKNEFRYRLFLIYLDLSELKRVFALHPLWSCDRPNIAWFRREDHFGDPQVPYQNGRRLFDASLELKRREVTRRDLGRVLVQYPLMTVKVVAMIYWQAVRLKLKGAPFYPHPRKRPAAAERRL